MKLDQNVFNSAEDMMQIAEADYLEERRKRATKKVTGPQGGAKARFEEWFASEDLEGLPAREIASLGFDAGHAFEHIAPTQGADARPVAITEAMAEEIGENGAPHSENERRLYEAYCKGHCWEVGAWSGTEYCEMLDRIRFAMWRDRAALGAPIAGVAA